MILETNKQKKYTVVLHDFNTFENFWSCFILEVKIFVKGLFPLKFFFCLYYCFERKLNFVISCAFKNMPWI